MRFSKLILFGLLLFGVPAAQAQNPLRPVFPTAVATDQTMGVACNSGHTTLLASVTSASMSLSVNNSSQFCAPAWVTLDSGTPNVEVIQICSVASFTLNVCAGGRGVHSAATGHSSGATVDAFVDQSYINQAAAEIEGIEGALGASLSNVNPMTALGDMIYGGIAGAPTRIAKPADGLHGFTFASSVPSWTALGTVATLAAPAGSLVGTGQSNIYTTGTQSCAACQHTTPTIVVASTGSLPGTCTAGELAFVTAASAGQQIYECSAANVWTQQTGGSAPSGFGFFGWQFTAPTLSSFSWVHHGSATAAQFSHYVTLSMPGAGTSGSPPTGGVNPQLLLISAPSLSYVLTAYMTLDAVTYNYTNSGLCIYDGSSGKLITWGISSNFGPTVNLGETGSGYGQPIMNFLHWSSLTAVDTATSMFSLSSGVFIQIGDDGTNLTFSLSYDGIYFTPVFVEARTTYLNPTQIGFFIDAESQYPAAVNVWHWSFGALTSL